MDAGDDDNWERIIKHARRTIAAHVLSAQEFDPAMLAAEILRLQMATPSDDARLRLEIYIRRELPAIERMTAGLRKARDSDD